MLVFARHYKRFTYLLFITLTFAGSAYCVADALDLPPRCQRLVSLSPSVTESIYFLDLQDRLVAVSQYDRYPPQVETKPKVGALFGTNLEALLSYQPSTILLLDEQYDTKAQLEKLKIQTLTVDHRSVDGILDSLAQIADYCAAKRGRDKAAKLRSEYQQWQKRTANLNRPRVLILLAAQATDGVQTSAYVLGRDGFYLDLLQAAGGDSVYAGMTKLLPDVSLEGILALKPEVIIVLSEKPGQHTSALIKQIEQLVPEVPAVKHKRMYALSQDYLLIPGPRFLLTLERIFSLLHGSVSVKQL